MVHRSLSQLHWAWSFFTSQRKFHSKKANKGDPIIGVMIINTLDCIEKNLFNICVLKILSFSFFRRLTDSGAETPSEIVETLEKPVETTPLLLSDVHSTYSDTKI